ncbi:hypothetical protein [Streptomyces sp. NPDC052107]|uniref:hypothetical protein n=1 Tax=Streptomyces sp. NPDC052107 TaxID=3155632 RepID=UPI003427C19F
MAPTPPELLGSVALRRVLEVELLNEPAEQFPADIDELMSQGVVDRSVLLLCRGEGVSVADDHASAA